MTHPLPEGKEGTMNGICGDDNCRWVWPIAYLPMDLTTAAELALNARCPACGCKKVFAT